MNGQSTVAASAFAAILAAACTQAPDPYDPAKMDLKPVAAKLSNERHKGRSRPATTSCSEVP
jgi:predicted component of type VI protein secretion system